VTLFLLAAGFAGGALNAVAGGGSFIGLPALIFAGVPPVAANATNAMALWPGSISSAWAYRRELATARAPAGPLGAISLLGGIIGGLLLLRTPDGRFLSLVPWLLLLASVTFTFGSRQHFGSEASQHFGGEAAKHLGLEAREHVGRAAPLRVGGAARAHVGVFMMQLLIAVYGGYFGGGIGIMMLAALAAAGMTNIHEMNAVKSALSVVINGVAVLEFAALGAIAWSPGLVMLAGAVAGGYAGAAAARRVAPRYINALVLVVAWGMTLYFFLR
jgi:uncharacterized membrane protein YfcA